MHGPRLNERDRDFWVMDLRFLRQIVKKWVIFPSLSVIQMWLRTGPNRCLFLDGRQRSSAPLKCQRGLQLCVWARTIFTNTTQEVWQTTFPRRNRGIHRMEKSIFLALHAVTLKFITQTLASIEIDPLLPFLVETYLCYTAGPFYANTSTADVTDRSTI